MKSETEIIRKLKKENCKLKQELADLSNTKLIRKLNKSLERIEKGKFITRAELGI